MTLCFPDVNVWIALSDLAHEHSRAAWRWMEGLPDDARLAFCRHTQIGLLRLLVTPSVMGPATLTLGQAWAVYDRWMEDPRVELYPEPGDAADTFRRLTASFAAQNASKAIGDCWLLALAAELGATLVTFDRPLREFAHKRGHSAVIPS